eukprot:XP_001695850.1 predicted protein [Chlamydomonas reinhardtii]
MSSAWESGKDAAVRECLLRACQRSRERAEPPIVNKATFRWPVAAPVPAGEGMDHVRAKQELYARMGYLTAAIDARYHGQRAAVPADLAAAVDAAASAAGPAAVSHMLGDERCGPAQPKHRAARVSLGGMFTWLTAAADPRVAVAAPVMGVQAFGWALGAGAWGARVDSIPLVFEVAADDLAAAEKEKAKEKEQRQGGHAAPTGVAVGAEGVQGNGGGAADAASGRGKVTADVVRAVWDKLLPGLLTDFDGPGSLPLIPLRPLLWARHVPVGLKFPPPHTSDAAATEAEAVAAPPLEGAAAAVSLDGEAVADGGEAAAGADGDAAAIDAAASDAGLVREASLSSRFVVPPCTSDADWETLDARRKARH